MTTIFNVLFKSVEKYSTPFCRAFSTMEKAENFIEECCEKSNFTIKSNLHVEDLKDYRVEDKEGNSYYFVIFFQEI